MKVYHGSWLEISNPDLEHSRMDVDFGKGFYTTLIWEQAVKCCGKFKRRGKKGIVSVYDFDETTSHNLKILKFESYSELYFDQLIDKREAINRLRYEKPNMQICFRIEAALSKLCFEGSVEV